MKNLNVKKGIIPFLFLRGALAVVARRVFVNRQSAQNLRTIFVQFYQLTLSQNYAIIST
jgi:hypothetical protein